MTRGAPLAGRRVVVTRSEAQADGLADALRGLGAEVLLVPSVQTRPAPDPAALDAAARSLADAVWLGVTSPNGVRFGWPAVRRAWPLGLPLGLGVAAVGPSTADALSEVGAPVHFVPSVPTGDAFAAELPLRPGARVVLLRSDLARQATAETLRQRGADVVDAVAYRTVPAADTDAVRHALDARPDAVTFTSPSTVRGFLTGVGDPGRLASVHLLPIGPTTADQIRDLGLRPAVVPDPYTVDGLVDALVRLFSE